MSGHRLSFEQEDMLRKLIEAHNRSSRREQFTYVEDWTGPGGNVRLRHRGLPDGEAHVYLEDLVDLYQVGYIQGIVGGKHGRFHLPFDTLDYFESLQSPAEEDSKTKTAPIPGPGDQTRPSPLLILDEIRGGQMRETRLARIVGAGRFDGVDREIGSRQLFFIYLLFKSTRTHWVDGQQIIVISQDEAGDRFLEWNESGFLKLNGLDRDNPKYRVSKMWREFVLQMDKVDKLKGIFESKLTNDQGNKLFGLRLAHSETQILVPDLSALFRIRPLGHG